MTEFSGLTGAVAHLRESAQEAHEKHLLDEYPGIDLDHVGQAGPARLSPPITSLTQFFEPWATLPDPGKFRDLANSLKPALGKLVVPPDTHADFVESGSISGNPQFDLFTNPNDLIPTWIGDAALTFENVVAPRIPTVTSNEFCVVEALRGPLLAAESLWTEARKDVCKWVDTAQASIDIFLEEPSAEGPGLGAILGIVGAVVGVAAIPFTGGLSAGVVPAAFSITTGALGLAGAAVGLDTPDAPDEEELAGGTPAEIIVSLMEKMNDYNQRLFYEEFAIQDSIYKVTREVNGQVLTRNPDSHPNIPDDDYLYRHNARLQGSYTMPRPALADVTQQNATDQDKVGRPPRLH